MDTSFSHSLVRLGAEELLSVQGARGRCLVVFHGKVWVTQHGDAHDHILSSGESFTFDHAGLALVEALEPTSLVLLVEQTVAPESIGYEAAWPYAEPATARVMRQRLRDEAQALRTQTGRKAARSVASAARKVWSGLTGGTPLRQAA